MKACLFLLALLIVSVSMDMVYGDKTKAEEQPDKGDGLEVLTVKQNVQQLLPLIESHSVEKEVELFGKTDFDRAYGLLKTLHKKSDSLTPLERDEHLQVIFGVALLYSGNPEHQFKILDLIVENPQLHTGAPLAYVAAQSSYPAAIAIILAWAESRLLKSQPLLQDMAGRSLRYAVKKNDLESLKALHAHGATITPARATDLVWYAVTHKSSPEILQFLIGLGAQINDQRSGYTPLIKAVSLNNMAAVKTLVDAGADLSVIVNDEAGSAIQQAAGGGYTEIELYLRDKGAK